MTSSAPKVGQTITIPPANPIYPNAEPSEGGDTTITAIRWDGTDQVWFCKTALRPNTWLNYDRLMDGSA